MILTKLFDVQNGVVIPTEHCYTLKALKDVMDEYPDDYLKIYLYLFYMSCPNPDLNPFFFTPDIDKETLILEPADLGSIDENKLLNLSKPTENE